MNNFDTPNTLSVSTMDTLFDVTDCTCIIPSQVYCTSKNHVCMCKLNPGHCLKKHDHGCSCAYLEPGSSILCIADYHDCMCSTDLTGCIALRHDCTCESDSFICRAYGTCHDCICLQSVKRCKCETFHSCSCHQNARTCKVHRQYCNTLMYQFRKFRKFWRTKNENISV
jgi:hypothetical protein